MTYKEGIDQANNFGLGLRYLGLCAVNNTYEVPCKFISIFAPNIVPWYLMDIACMMHGFTLAPLYATLGPDTVAYVLN